MKINLKDTIGPEMLVEITNVTCKGDNTGRIELHPADSNLTYSYHWNYDLGQNNSAEHLSAGRYEVLVIDNNNCKTVVQCNISEPEHLETKLERTFPSSDTAEDGTIKINVWGGIPPYQFSWSNGSHDNLKNDLGAGTYEITVTDSNQCSINVNTNLRSYINSVQLSCTENTPFDQNQIDALQQNCTSCDPMAHYPDLDIVRDFGAIPNDGYSDEISFEWANEFINTMQACSIAVNLEIPYGEYIVGRQDIDINNDHLTPFAKGHDVLCFEGCNFLNIIGVPDHSGNLPAIKFEDCLLYGAYNYTNGQRYLSGTLACNGCPNFAKIDYAAYPGFIFSFVNCNNIVVKNLELNGNKDNLSVGGYWAGDAADIQLSCGGIWLNGCESAIVENLNIHDFGQDGIMVHDERSGQVNPIDITLLNSKFNWNGRNGLDWAGGNKLTAINCEFNYNGFSSWNGTNPRCGVDIEWESFQNVENGTFDHCRFKYNSSRGVASNLLYTFNKWNFQFSHCTFVASSDGFALEPGARKMEFTCCEFYGHVQSAYNAYLGPQDPMNDDNLKFIKCEFKEEYTDPDLFGSPKFAFTHDNGDCINVSSGGPECMIQFYASRILFDRCKIETNQYNKWCILQGGADPINFITVKNSSFYNYGLNCHDLSNSLHWADTQLGQFSYVNFPSGNFNRTYSIPSPFQNSCQCQYNQSGYCFSVLACSTGLQYCLGSFPIASTAGSGWCGLTPCSQVNGSLYPNAFLSESTCVPKYDDSSLRANFWNIYQGCSSTGCGIDSPPICPSCPPPCLPNGSRNSGNSKDIDFSISPNPTTDFVNSNNIPINSEISIRDVLGNIIYSYHAMESHLIIDTRNLKAGIYFITINGENTYNSKLIIKL